MNKENRLLKCLEIAMEEKGLSSIKAKALASLVIAECKGPISFNGRSNLDRINRTLSAALVANADMSNAELGDIGEEVIIQDLIFQGFTEIFTIKNNSNHGIDIIMVHPQIGHVKVIEVKVNSSRLSPAQKEGGVSFVEKRLRSAIARKGHWAPENTPFKHISETAEDLLHEVLLYAPVVEHEVVRIKIDAHAKKAHWIKSMAWV